MGFGVRGGCRSVMAVVVFHCKWVCKQKTLNISHFRCCGMCLIHLFSPYLNQKNDGEREQRNGITGFCFASGFALISGVGRGKTLGRKQKLLRGREVVVQVEVADG